MTPWLQRRDWVDRAVKQSKDPGAGCLWGFAILWNLFSLPLWFLARWKHPVDPKNLLFASFPIAGVLMLLLALYQTLRARKYGASLCRIERVPISLGTTFRGELDVRLREMPDAGFALRLACVRRTVSRGKNRSVHERVLWQDEQIVEHGPMPSPHGMRVPFRFDIPFDCEPTDVANSEDSVIWRLDASADVPGIDYAASFELPVFRTEDSRDELVARVHSSTSWQPSREITVSHDAVVIRPGSRFGDWFPVVLFFPLWYGALALVRQFGAPLLVVVLFGAIGALVALIVLDFLLGRTTVSASPAGVVTRRTWLGLGRRVTIPVVEIASIESRIGSMFGNRAYHDVRVVLRNGRTRGVARHVRNKRDAERLAEWLSQKAGL